MQNAKTQITIKQRIDQTAGHSSGFDYMRLALATSIVCFHTAITSYGLAADVALFTSFIRPLMRFVLPAFFALSGFLVAGSLMRSRTLLMFLGLRALRIYPALAVEVLLSAFILGPLITTHPLSEYFTSKVFFSYLLNVFGDIHFALPGVFENNPLPSTVNGQLWTIPFELYSYITLSLVTILGLKRNRLWGPIAVGSITFAYLIVTLLRHHGQIVPVEGGINGALLVATFWAGVVIYLYKDMLPWSASWAIAAAIITTLCLEGWVPLGDFIAPLPAAYLTVWLGLLNPKKKFLFGADYSYGIFLYGFAIQQTIAAVLPPAYRQWYISLILSLPAVFVVAAASWHFVEKPAQSGKKKLKIWEEKWLNYMRGKEPLLSKIVWGSAITASGMFGFWLWSLVFRV